jgi:hypothetical protein
MGRTLSTYPIFATIETSENVTAPAEEAVIGAAKEVTATIIAKSKPNFFLVTIPPPYNSSFNKHRKIPKQKALKTQAKSKLNLCGKYIIQISQKQSNFSVTIYFRQIGDGSFLS